MAYQTPVQQQPAPTQGMTISGGNKNAKNIPVGPNGREWSNDLLSCFDDCGTCFISWCFPSITYGSNKRRLEHLQIKGVPDPEQGGVFSSDCAMHCCIMFCFGAGWVLSMASRGSTRARYNISGGTCADCLASAFCGPCALTQESREIELEELSFANQAGPGKA